MSCRRFAWLAVLLVACCKPAGFAGQQADLMRSPPPLLPHDVNGFWNDTGTNTYGEFTVGPGLFRRGDATCRSARVTSINAAAHVSDDRTLLYCAGPDGDYHLDRSLSCRMAVGALGLVCRNPEGDDVSLPPV